MMRDLETALGKGVVNLNVAGNRQSQYNAKPTTIVTNKKAINKITPLENAADDLNTQQIDQLKEQFLEEDSQIQDNFHAQEHSHRWCEEAQRASPDIPEQIQHSQRPSKEEESTKEATYSQLLPSAGSFVSETQLNGIFEDTQFHKGFTKPSTPDSSKETQDVYERIEESQDTQYIDDLKQRLLEEETQILVSDGQLETHAKRVKEQQPTRVHKKEREDAGAESIKKHVAEKERILSQADHTQFNKVIKAQAPDSIVDSQDNGTSQLKKGSGQDRIFLLGTSAESQRPGGVDTQGSDHVLLFPIGTSFDGGGETRYTLSQSPSQNAQQRAFVAPIYSFKQSGESQAAAQRDVDNLSVQPTSHPQNTKISVFSQPKITERLGTDSNNKHNKKKASTEDINRLKTRAMDDWSRESMGTASQTQANDSAPRNGTAVKSKSRSKNEGGSLTKKIRSSSTHSQSSGKDAHFSGEIEEGTDSDCTYNEDESGAVRLEFTQSQDEAEESQNLQASQDRGLKSPSYDFAGQDDTSQLEPETPSTSNKNPFAKNRSAVPMPMSQVFAATQSSPLDPRFLHSEGIRPSSPGMSGLASSPAMKRAQTLPTETSSPSHVELTIASSFQPFDESTQLEPSRKIRLGKWKAETESQRMVEAQYAHYFVGRTDPGDLRLMETKENRPKTAESAKLKQKPITYESDDGMDIEEENRKRIEAKRLKDMMEKNLKEVGDMATGPRDTSPPLDRVRRAASTGRAIVKNDVRGARLRERQRQSLEGTISAPDKAKKAEEVEVPASGEATRVLTTRKASRKNICQSEKCRAQSEGVDVNARNTQDTESQVTRSCQIIYSGQPRRNSQLEVVADSQTNISTEASTQPDSTRNLQEEVEDSYKPLVSAARASPKLGRTDSGILPNLGGDDLAPSSHAISSPPGTSVPVTSSGHYLKKPSPSSTPGGSKPSNETAPEVVPETSPLRKTPSKTASPEKPFGNLSQVVDSPMKSFADFPMTQEPPEQIDPNEVTTSTSNSAKKVCGKKSTVKSKPEQKMSRRSRVIFTDEPSKASDNEQDYLKGETPTKIMHGKKPEKASKAPENTMAAKKAKAGANSAGMVVYDDDAMNALTAEEVQQIGKRAVKLSKRRPSRKSAERVVDSDDRQAVLTPATDKIAKGRADQKSTRSVIVDEKNEKVVAQQKGRNSKTKIASPPVPEQSQLFCTQVSPDRIAVSLEKTRSRTTKKTKPSPLGTVVKNNEGYRNPSSTLKLPPQVVHIADFEAAKKVRKAGAFILDEDSEGSDFLPVSMAKKVCEVKEKQAAQLHGILAVRTSFSPHSEENEYANVDALTTVQQLNTDRGRRKGKRITPRIVTVKAIPSAEDKSPDSSPIRPSNRRSTRRQQFEMPRQAQAPTPTSDNLPIQGMVGSDEDDVPIARPVTKMRKDDKIHDRSDAKIAGTSPVRNVIKPTPYRKSTTLLKPEGSDEEDESVSPVRPSIEGNERQGDFFINRHTYTKDHSKDGLIHDAALRAISEKRRASLNIPSTANSGNKGSSRTSSVRDCRSASEFIRPDSADAPHLQPPATGDCMHRTPLSSQQQVSENVTVFPSTARRSVESSPLSEIASDVAEELEEFHTAQVNLGTSRQESTGRWTTGIKMNNALLMPSPQTVSRRLNFAELPLVGEYIPPVLPGKGKGKRSAAGSAGGKRKKARKTTPQDNLSRPRHGASITAAASVAAADGDDDEKNETIIVEETPRATPRNTPPRRQGRKVSRPSYVESPSTNGNDDDTIDLTTIVERTRSSRTPSSKADDLIVDNETESRPFKGMAFAISYKRSDEAAVKDRKEVTTLILAHGGEIIEDFKDLFEKTDIDDLATPAVSRANSTNTSFAFGSRRGSAQTNSEPQDDNKNDNDNNGDLRLTEHAKTLGFVAFIGDTYSRKSKFLQALALGLPCLSSFWIRRCIAMKSILQWTGPYMLQAGESRKMHGMVVTRFIQPYSAITSRFEKTFRNRRKMLEGKGMLFLFSKSGRGKAGVDNKLKRKHYLWLTRALGARQVRLVASGAEARRLIVEAGSKSSEKEATRGRAPRAGWDIIYVDDEEKVGSVKREVGMREEARKVRVVSDEFVVQSLILGWLEDEDLKDEA